MFHLARLKLTGWYLFILILVSFLFSAIIYRGVNQELERGFRRAELRLRAQEIGIILPPNGVRHIFLVEDIDSAKKRVLYWLVMTNVFILGVSSIASYVLAGKTLKPIQISLDEQKRFVADASHELHTPLTALKTSLEVALRNKSLTKVEARKVMRSNLEEVDELAILSQNLLTLSRFEHNGNNLPLHRLDLGEVLGEVVSRFTTLAKVKQISLSTANDNHIIIADESSLTQLFNILVDNAIKYTLPGGTVKITVTEAHKALNISVIDTGIGIPKKDLPHIFNRFYRADSSRTRADMSGFGLGLSIAKRIVDLHHGTINVESESGKGTSFTVSLPIV